ncbi:MAG: hypothetical protein IKU86_13050 [Thermoguttaceae bacterium]|nr:hypothetical protein [Thermoguttaceae bacterium]
MLDCQGERFCKPEIAGSIPVGSTALNVYIPSVWRVFGILSLLDVSAKNRYGICFLGDVEL